MRRTYELRILGVFVALLLVYLLIAFTLLAPTGYYGSPDEPDFSDPWIARVETILSGGLLYRDVFTTTPPLINFLLVPPVLLSSLFGHRNPWATLSFMGYFSLFNLFTAYVLLHTSESKEEGYRSALCFLLNPLTFGNSLLRRQDEPILVFFFSLALLFALHRQHWKAGVAIGLSLLVKLSGALIIPVTFLQTRDWRYLIVPAVVAGLIFAPFLLAAGESAIFWDASKERMEHPFQFKGISLGRLWAGAHDGEPLMSLEAHSAVLVVGAAAVLALIAWKPNGLLEDLAFLTTIGLMLSPKAHCGYFSLLALIVAPLLRKYRITWLYLSSGLVILMTDMFKSNPLKNFPIALGLMAIGFLLLIAAMVWIRWPHKAEEAETAA